MQGTSLATRATNWIKQSNNSLHNFFSCRNLAFTNDLQVFDRKCDFCKTEACCGKILILLKETNSFSQENRRLLFYCPGVRASYLVSPDRSVVHKNHSLLRTRPVHWIIWVHAPSPPPLATLDRNGELDNICCISLHWKQNQKEHWTMFLRKEGKCNLSTSAHIHNSLASLLGWTADLIKRCSCPDFFLKSMSRTSSFFLHHFS